jgi:hypothetical protein
MSPELPPEDKQEFINCKLAFMCTNNWHELEPTGKAGIKHCHHCGEDVHLCVTQEELSAAIEHKFCIAYFKNPSLQTRFQLSREKCETNRIDPDFELELTLGLPKRRGANKKLGELSSSESSDKLKKFLED